ncbi:Flp family type IVb pilin [Aurantiacibacter odishensis]|uniref:Flp family type IVb pilin n=1 Tax=Aurantiacibacter odishensis TaxID=1155476 RepID=UPI000E74810D|nr:Flp family type IVb pilin [Aurantiacibacter odishensis]
MAHIQALLADETGATGIEYGLLASFIAVALVGSFNEVRAEVSEMFGHVEDEYASVQ